MPPVIQGRPNQYAKNSSLFDFQLLLHMNNTNNYRGIWVNWSNSHFKGQTIGTLVVPHAGSKGYHPSFSEAAKDKKVDSVKISDWSNN